MSSAPSRSANGFSMLKTNTSSSALAHTSASLASLSVSVPNAAAPIRQSGPAAIHTSAQHPVEPATAHARLSTTYDEDNRLNERKKDSASGHHAHSLSSGHVSQPTVANLTTASSSSTPRTGTPSQQSTTSPSPSHAHSSPNTSSTAAPPPNSTASALSNALAAAAASTSASLFNLKELFETVKMMSSGRVFTGYFANQSLMEPIKQDLFVFFDCSPAAAAALQKQKSASVPGGANTDIKHQALGGALYWSVVGRDGSLHRTRAADLSLALSEIDDIYLGKRTTAFTLPFAANAREECCFSLIAKNRTHMNFEAKNPVSLVSWLFGLKRIVQANKKLLEAAVSPAQPFSLAAVAGGGFLDIHDTNQTNLKQDIWTTFLQGIQAGMQLFQQSVAQNQQQKAAAAQQQNTNSQSTQQSTQQAPHPPPQQQQQSSSQSGGFLSNLLNKDKSSKASATTTPPSSNAAGSSQPNTSPVKPSSNANQRSNPMPLPSDPSIDPLQIFQILGRIGQGNYGYVYKARDLRCTNPQEALVAIKILEVDSAATSRELEAEIQILAQCHSKYIVAYRGTFIRNTPSGHQQVWIVMEYCLAGSCCDLMAITDRILTEEQIGAVLKMSLQGLSYFHSLNHLHRDVKAGNLLINHDGIVKLSDFGVSAQLSASLSKRKTLMGSPYWMAPEVMTSSAHNQPYNEKADVWSLGATAIELATGDPPFHDLHPMKAIFAIPSLPAPRLPQHFADGQPCGWSADFEDFVAACMMKDPSFRPSASQLLNHPFISKAAGSSVIKQLVIDCMPDIDKYREIEARMANKIAFGSRRGRAGEDSDSETSISRSRSSISRSQYEPSYHGGGMRSVHSISDMRGMSSQNRGSFVHTGNAASSAATNYPSNPRAARWEKELSRSERDRDRRVREKEWERDLELSRREVDYSQRSASPSFSTSSIGGAYWSSHDKFEREYREKDGAGGGTRERHGSVYSSSQQQPAARSRFRASGTSNPGVDGSSSAAAVAAAGGGGSFDGAQHSPPSMRRSISQSANSAFVRARVPTGSMHAHGLTPSRGEREREGSFEADSFDASVSGDQLLFDEPAEQNTAAAGSGGKAFDASPSFNTLYYRAAAARQSGSDGFSPDGVISPKNSSASSSASLITAGGLPANLTVGVHNLSSAPHTGANPSPTSSNTALGNFGEGDRTRPSSATLAAHAVAAAAAANGGVVVTAVSSASVSVMGTPVTPNNDANRCRTPLASEKAQRGSSGAPLPATPLKTTPASVSSSSASASSSATSSPPPPPLPHLPSNSASPLTLNDSDDSEVEGGDDLDAKLDPTAALSKAQRKRQRRKEKAADKLAAATAAAAAPGN